MKCRRCGGKRFHPGCLITPGEIYEGPLCGKCGLVPREGRKTDDRRKLSERCQVEVSIQTVYGGIQLTVDGKLVKLSLREADLFQRAASGAYHCARRGKEHDENKRLNLNRWVLLGDTAQFRKFARSKLDTVSLRRTTPRRGWKCSQCTGALLPNVQHWIGVKPNIPKGQYIQNKYWGPPMPRFCDRCVHAAKADPEAVIRPGRPLRVVGASAGAEGPTDDLPTDPVVKLLDR